MFGFTWFIGTERGLLTAWPWEIWEFITWMKGFSIHRSIFFILFCICCFVMVTTKRSMDRAKISLSWAHQKDNFDPFFVSFLVLWIWKTVFYWASGGSSSVAHLLILLTLCTAAKQLPSRHTVAMDTPPPFPWQPRAFVGQQELKEICSETTSGNNTSLCCYES